MLSCPSPPEPRAYKILAPTLVDEHSSHLHDNQIEIEFDKSMYQYLIGVPGIPEPGEHIIAKLISTTSSLCSATNGPISGSSRFTEQSPSWQYAIVEEFGELTRD